MIYFISCKEAGLVKIGCTQGDAVMRLKQLQHSSPFELEIIGAQEGDRSLETELHKRFKQEHVRSEWFKFSDRIKQYVADVGAMERYRDVAKVHIRDLIKRESVRNWTPHQRALWREFKDSSLSSTFFRWREHMGPLAKSDEEKIIRFLTDNGLIADEKVAA